MMKLIRTVLLALIGSLIFGLIVGTIIRTRMERPTRYIVSVEVGGSAIARNPGDVADAGAMVLEACEHEEQIG